MAQQSVTQTIFGWLVDFLEDARDLLTGADTRRAIIADLGGNPSAPGTPPQFPPAGLESAKSYRDSAEPDLEAFFAAIQDIKSCVDVVRSFVDSLDLGPEAVANEVFRDLIDLLLLNFVRLRAPRLYFVMQAVSFAEDFSSEYGGEFGGFMGVAHGMRSLAGFLFSPCSWFDQSNFDDEEGVRRISDRTLFAVAAMTAYSLKVPEADGVLYGWDLVPGVPGSATPTAVDRTLARALTLASVDARKQPQAPALSNTSLWTTAFLPRTQGGPGLFVSLGGGFEIDTEIVKPWYLSGQMQGTGAVSYLISKKRGFETASPFAGADFRGGIALEARPDPASNKAFDIRLAKGTGISVGLLRFELGVTKDAATIKTVVRTGVLSIGKIFDGFLDTLIPGDGLRMVFDFGVGLASDRGLFLEGQVPTIGSAGTPPAAPPSLPPPGGAVVPPPLPPLPKPEASEPGVSLRIPIGKSLGPLTIHDVQVRAGAEGSGADQAYLLEAASSIGTKLGPVTARVDRIGLRVAVRMPDDHRTANVGIADLDVSPKFPDGIGLAIDAKGILTGGGFVFRDASAQLYAGVMQLTLHERITIKAFGLIATRLPDGRPGFSLLVFITAEDFRPYPLGMACTLQGIGGLVGINRTFNEDAMREGLKNNTLATLLFPRDPIRNAPEIIRNLSVVFPARSGSALFGILAKIGWFSPTLVLLELALILEFDGRLRLIALGRISSKLPSRDNDLIRLNLDAMGVIDFDEGTVAIDAVIVDSRLAHKFVLTGGAALRARFKAGPGSGFAVAIGGLNPRFAPPAGLPALDRVAIALASGNNPRLTCAAYFAITPNTIQFGARAQLYAEAAGFSVEGDVGFDVLIELSPFHFIADFHASIQLKRGSRNLFKVAIAGELEGPRPLRVSGKASFEILWCDFSVRFDKTLISGEKPPLPPAVNVFDELSRALAAAESWTTLGAVNRQHGVALRALVPGTPLVLDPLGNLSVKQAVVPLNASRDIDTFGGAPVAGARRFRLTATLSGQAQQVVNVKDQFVPSQFFAMTDDEKLAGPSFEDMDAGVVFGSDVFSFDAAQSVPAPLAFKTIVIDPAGGPPPVDEPYVLSAAALLRQTRFGAVAQASVRRTGLARFRDADAPQAATVHVPEWVIASVASLATAPALAAAGSTWVERRAAMTALNRAAGTEQWQLVPAHEITAG
jgi:hypothetical protein